MCAEKDHRNCHRHNIIAKRLSAEFDIADDHIIDVDGTVIKSTLEQTRIFDLSHRK